MTGFGRAVADVSIGRLTVEIQSVNRKYLEINLSTPRELARFEPEIRKWVGEGVARGQVSVRIFLVPNAGALEGSLPDVKLLKSLKKQWEKVAKEAGYDSKEITLEFLLQFLPPKQEEVEKEPTWLKKCVEEALESFLKMKKTEGKALSKDFADRLKALEKMVDQIEALSPESTKKMREKLLERMEEVFKPGAEIEDRLMWEVALFAERVDISEEITRFRSHVAQFRELLKGTTVGRKMDFLIQEMGREVNTIGSKASEAKISHLVVEMKSELEKIREQVQNIE